MHLTRELARASRLKSEVSLLVMDLDNFKDINDTYGHHVGDRALREVAGVLRAAIRPYDICVRYAGDEFIVVLSGCGGDEAERKRLELQRAVDTLQFEPRPGRAAAAGDQHRRGRSSRTTASRTKRCWPRPTAGCTATRRAASARARPTPARADRPPPARRKARSSDRRSAFFESKLAVRHAPRASPALDFLDSDQIAHDPTSRSTQSGLTPVSPSRAARGRLRRRRGSGLRPTRHRSGRRTGPSAAGRTSEQPEHHRQSAGCGPGAGARRGSGEALTSRCDSISRRAPDAADPRSAAGHAARARRAHRPRRPAISLLAGTGGAHRDARPRAAQAVFDRSAPEDAERDGWLELLVGVDAEGRPGRT